MHAIRYEGGLPESDAQVVLVESDVLNDEGMHRHLSAAAPFDAVACWLMGTHSAREANEAIDALHIATSAEYRLRVQNRVYELADTVLRPGGVLHVVDRGQAPTSKELVEDIVRAHEEQAEVTSLVVRSPPTWRPYEADAGGMPMILTFPRPPTGPVQFALVSIVSDKPVG
jgi:hypothetical protein